MFTDHKSKKNGIQYEEDIYLWMTDGTRVAHVGAIASKAERTSYKSVLQTNNSFFALLFKYKNYNDYRHGVDEVLFILQTEHLKNMRFYLKAWEESDKTVLAFCEKTENINICCTTPPPTDGLVGFLHNTTNTDSTKNIIWKDEYYYSNATVETGEKGINGFKFSGKGAGAKWPVGKQRENQPYSFVDFGFTLVATVNVGSSTSDSKNNSVLGVVLTENNKVGLWCTNDGEWGVSGGDGRMNIRPSAVNCTPDKTYYVALILNKTEINVYVDGQHLSKLDGGEMDIKPLQNIKYFYFGVDNKEKNTTTDVTIKNVLLYNRPFTAKEIEQLKLKQNDKTDIQTNTGSDISSSHNLSENIITIDKPTSTSVTHTATEKSDTKSKEGEKTFLSSSPPPPPTTEDSPVRVGVVEGICIGIIVLVLLLVVVIMLSVFLRQLFLNDNDKHKNVKVK